MADNLFAVPASPQAMGAIDVASNLDVQNGEAFNNFFQNAIEKAAVRPAAEGALPTQVDLLTGSTTGPVGEAKTGLVAETSSATASGTENSATDTQMQEATEARMRALYTDLTNYQIAWRIAQRMQQDISQLLRGS